MSEKTEICFICNSIPCKGTSTYKFRCELITDSSKFIKEFIKATYGDIVDLNIKKVHMLGCTIELSTHCKIEAVRKVLYSVPSSHVMIETLELLENYTGIRE